MNKRIILFIIGCTILAITGIAFADSCPCCGQTYGEGSGSDWDYISSIRAAHEAECCGSSDTGGYDGGDSYGGYDDSYDNSWEIRQQGAALEQGREKKRLEKIKREKEERVRRLEEEIREEEEFQRKKSELTSSLKGASTSSGLKTIGSGTGLKLKGLKTREIPSPLGLKSYSPQKELKLKTTKAKFSGKKNIIVEGAVKGYEKTKQDFIDWTYTSTFEMTLGKIPGVTYIKERYEEFKEMRKEMKELNMNIFQYAMKGMQDGVDRSMSSDLSDGGLADEYEEGRRGLFGRTAIKVRELLKKKIEE
ncbi:MAG: hypothetical protein KKD90_02935 [Candidatus Omnitrophica bacterium]|nr:hypothetical protein [Candidatus Omnitrophota bacterium]